MSDARFPPPSGLVGHSGGRYLRVGSTVLKLLDLALPIARRLDPEDAHGMAVRALAALPIPRFGGDDPLLRVSAFGLEFPNPIGIAAGFDKNAEVPDALLRAGFGFAEVGTVTPRPQPGNPRPRIFRLPEDEGIINRLGFNSEGFAPVHARLAARDPAGVVGINIGANRDSKDRVSDYLAGIERFAPFVGYFAINVSSPNTPGLRDLQAEKALDDLLARAIDARDRAVRRRPLLLKIAPDLSLQELDDAVAVARKRGLDGMIVSNTTVSRSRDLRDPAAGEQGGLSGRPLFALSTWMLSETFRRVEGAFPLVGVGGIDSAETAWRKIRAGASLIQLYSALAYKGFGLIGEIRWGLSRRLRAGSHRSIAEIVGRDAGAI